MKQVKSKSVKSDQTQQLNQTQSERWFTQMIKCLPPKCKPDIGHRFYREGITNPVIMLSGSCILLADKMGIQITTSSGLECASILMSKPDALKLFPPDSMPTRKNFSYYDMGEYSCIIECQLMPNLRYQASNGEFVLPMIGTPKSTNSKTIVSQK